MNRRTQILKEGQSYYQDNRKRIWIAGLAILFIILLATAGFAARTVTAQDNKERIKLVTSIEIEKGDSLWSIASEYMSEEYDSINDYIEEIKDSNGISSDEIHSGNFIIVPYYADAT